MPGMVLDLPTALLAKGLLSPIPISSLPTTEFLCILTLQVRQLRLFTDEDTKVREIVLIVQ